MPDVRIGILDVRVRSDLTLTGVDKAEALEFEFDASPDRQARTPRRRRAPGAGAIGMAVRRAGVPRKPSKR